MWYQRTQPVPEIMFEGEVRFPIVTLEPADGSPFPLIHVIELEGEWTPVLEGVDRVVETAENPYPDEVRAALTYAQRERPL